MKSYFRFLSRNKLYTLINVVGLVVSLMFIILIGDYTWRQYSIDTWHQNADRIYVVGNQESFALWPEATEAIKNMCPEVEQTCCVLSQKGRIKYGQQEVQNGANENGIIMMADSTFFQFFDFSLVAGDRQTALDAPDKCVITERLAHRLFGAKDPIGESLQVIGEFESDHAREFFDSTLVYTVSAVVKDLDHTVLPNETQIIISMERYPQVIGYRFFNYHFASTTISSCKAFFMLRPGMTLENKVKTIDDYIDKNFHTILGHHKTTVTPLKDMLFAPQNNGKGLLKGDKTRLRILLAAVFALLFFAVSNYINLTVANTGFRAKEIATRKLFGSSQSRVSLKLIAESTLMVAISFVIGLFLAISFQEEVSQLFRGKIALCEDINVMSVSVSLVFILLTGIVSGILPSMLLSRFQPIDIVKGNFRFHSKMVLGRLFIILQNVITVTMLTASLVIWLQLNHLIHAPRGFDAKNLYCIMSPDGKSQAIGKQLAELPFIEKMGTYEGGLFNYNFPSALGVVRGDQLLVLFCTTIDQASFDLLGLKIIKDHGSVSGGYYLTREALRQLGYNDETRVLDFGTGSTAPINGVLNDIKLANVLSDITQPDVPNAEEPPFAICIDKHKEFPHFLVKTNGDKKAKAVFQEMVKKLEDPNASKVQGIERVQSIEESIEKAFAKEQNTLKIVLLFTLIAIIISIMGFVGLSLFFIRQRQKEIGLRKIMGSTSGEVMMLMLRMFCTPLLLSFVIAIPLSWYVMTDWLSNFSYRISLSPWIFVVTSAFALLVAVLSVSLQILKAVRTNPVESIKTE
ncbi:putative ABC transport system permease protein [Prevotella sp. khp7]|uniref:ABC transporter permease n=1 Tax=Prevotella sp. khp7 TaxID=1761885 RepID=UPI0008D7FA76|nr:ABC transporter permease [Prevotella sp. khp7]SEW24862.1 putative ABC transport system permease protein [Prevotella sp. khp7]